MNEQLQLNGKLIEAYLADTQEGIKTQAWLAEKIGVTRSHVGQMLGGHVPNAKTVKKLAELLGCRMEELLIPKEAKRTA